MFRRGRGDEDFADEIQAHLDFEADELESPSSQSMLYSLAPGHLETLISPSRRQAVN